MNFDPEFSADPPAKTGPGHRVIRHVLIFASAGISLAVSVTQGWFRGEMPPAPVPTTTTTAPGAGASVISPTPPESPTYHLIVNRDTGQCLDVPYGGLEPRTRVEQFPVNGGGNQVWRIEPVVGNSVRIVNRHSGQSLDVPFGTREPGTPVEQFPINGGSNQGWRLVPVYDQWFRIVNDHTGQCLEVAGGSTERRAAIVQAPIGEPFSQQWRPIAVR